MPRPAATDASSLCGIYAIVDAALSPEPLPLLEAILAAGISVVQYRAKGGVERDILQTMLAQTRQSGARLIVNDDLEAALEADGLHAGQEDLQMLDVARIRERLGTRLLGVSCATPSEAQTAERFGADYVGVGPFAATSSKGDAGPAIGALGIAAVVRATALPVVAIGGIDLDNLASVVGAGAAMAAVISALACAAQPRSAAAALVSRWAELHA